MTKIDFKKTLKNLYGTKTGAFDLVQVPRMRFLSITGDGGPVGQAYADALKTLYPVAYGLKFMSKERGSDYVVPPLEALWWADDMSSFITRKKDQWKWRAMIMTPDWITEEDFKQSVTKAAAKKVLPALETLKFENFEEGLVLQTLHIGSYDDEGPILKQMHCEEIPKLGFEMTGHHHEVYFNDPRKVPAEKLKTLLRQPVRRC